MTSRELYDYALIELNKHEAPSLLLEDYNYFINKAIQQYCNLVYAKLEVDQQSTDDIRVLKTSVMQTPIKMTGNIGSHAIAGGMFESTYYVDLPSDYMHMANCIVEFTVNKSNFKCYDKGDTVYFAAHRLTSDMYTQIINNAYMRPMYKRPYYYLNNINTSDTLPTNPTMDNEIINKQGKDVTGAYVGNNSIDSITDSYDRNSNSSKVRLELRFGKDDTVFTPTMLYIDYYKSPMYIRLTQEQINSTLDYSQVLEFPDYVCFEIVNIFTRLIMENASDPRVQTNIPLNNTIPVPGANQQQTK